MEKASVCDNAEVAERPPVSSLALVASSRTYYEGPSYIDGDERVRQRYFTCSSEMGLVAGVACSVMFTLDRPAKEVWAVLRDFNLWQNAHRHYYSGVIGDLEGKTFRLSDKPNDPGPHTYKVLKVIPEYLIVVDQPLPADGTNAGLPGLGGVSPGFHVFMLGEHGGKTTVTIFMDHASRAESAIEEEALRPWREIVEAHWMRKWREDFIRTFKKKVYETRRAP